MDNRPTNVLKEQQGFFNPQIDKTIHVGKPLRYENEIVLTVTVSLIPVGCGYRKSECINN